MSIVELAQALSSLDEGNLAKITMAGENEDGEIVVPERAFQFWPESITDAINVNYVDKSIPGGSHDIKQWVSNSGRTISFQVQLSRTMKRAQDMPELTLGGVVKIGSKLDPQSTMNAEWNRDIRQDVLWLRSFCYPTYSGDSFLVAKPPPICLLNAEGLGLGHAVGNDFFIGVMVSCNVTYIRLFENGIPRLATVDLSFAEYVQQGGVQFHGLGDLKNAGWYSQADK